MQEVGKMMIYPQYLQNLHDILRNEKGDISVLKKPELDYIFLAWNIMFTDY